MKRVYIIVTLLLACAFVSFYVPWRAEALKDYELAGPGRIANAENILSIHILEERGIYIVEDPKAVASIVGLISPNFRNWRNASLVHRGERRLRFHFKTRDYLIISFGENYAYCGPYARILPAESSREIDRLLRTGRFVSYD